MAGGQWSTTDMPVLPGLYVNFQAAALAAVQSGARGTVIAPVKAHWGPVGEFVEITSETGLIDAYTQEVSGGASAYPTIRLALLGGASKVLAYRLADGGAAQAQLNLQDTSGTPADVLQLKAVYPGERGNGFRVTVQTNAVDSGKTDIRLYEDTTLLYTFTFESGTIDAAVTAVNGDSANRWVTASKLADGSGMLTAVTSAALSGGDSGIDGIAAADYTAALDAFETVDFNLLALDGVSDPAIQTSVVSWISGQRVQGAGVMAVLGGPDADDTASDAAAKAAARSAAWNQEGVVNVGTGAILDGAAYGSSYVAAYVAGLIAGQKLSESTTYAPSPFQDVTRRWTRSEQESAVKGGVYLLVNDGRQVKSLRGVNSLVTPAQGQNAAWKKIRTIRVMDAINRDLADAAADNYIGKVNNNEEGRLALIGAVKQYMESLAQSGIIESTGWDVALDPRYYGSSASITPEADQVYLAWHAKLTDAMEQIFGTFVVL